MEERAVAYSALDVLPRALLVLLVLPAVILGIEMDFAHLLAVVCISSLVSVIISAALTRPAWSGAMKHSAHHHAVGPLLSLGLPLFVASLVYWALTATGLIALRRWTTLESVAQYSVAMSVGNVAAIVQAMFTVIWSPMVFGWIARNEDLSRIDSVVDSLVGIGCSFLCLAALASPIVGLFLPAEYSVVPRLLVCALVPPLLYTVTEATGMGIVVVRKSMWAVVAAGIALLTNVAITWWLVPRLGAAGAVVAGAAAFTVFFVVKTEVSSRLWRPISRRRTYSPILIVVGLSIATTLLGESYTRAIAVSWAIALILVLLVFRAVWSDVLRRARFAFSQRQS
jgi:O-antigen/teichoic acid export membrane protein